MAQVISRYMSLLPNYGRPANWESPVNVDHLYPDPRSKDLQVYLVVTRSREPRSVPEDNHWKLCWIVGYTEDGFPVERRLHIVRENGMPHLTNWGPLTRSSSQITHRDSKYIPLKRMNHAQRLKLEGMVLGIPVREPDGIWNCQHWIRSLLDQAINQDLFTREECIVALKRASQVE